MILGFDCPCGHCGTFRVDPHEWEAGSVWSHCFLCGEMLTQQGNNLTLIDPQLPLAVTWVCYTGLDTHDRVLATARKEDPTGYGLPGGKVDPEDGPIYGPDRMRTLRRALAREVWEETGVILDENQFVVVHEGLCEGDSKEYWQVTMTHPHHDFVATTPDGGWEVNWVTWAMLENGPFGTANRTLYANLIGAVQYD